MLEQNYGVGQGDKWTYRPGNNEPGKQEVMLEKNPCLSSSRNLKPKDSLLSLHFPSRHYIPNGKQHHPGPSKLCSRRYFL